MTFHKATLKVLSASTRDSSRMLRGQHPAQFPFPVSSLPGTQSFPQWQQSAARGCCASRVLEHGERGGAAAPGASDPGFWFGRLGHVARPGSGCGAAPGDGETSALRRVRCTALTPESQRESQPEPSPAGAGAAAGTGTRAVSPRADRLWRGVQPASSSGRRGCPGSGTGRLGCASESPGLPGRSGGTRGHPSRAEATRRLPCPPRSPPRPTRPI